jgi:dsRNA-specific ribonuclease
MTEAPKAWRSFPTADEVAALTRDNPKGRLLEFCARARSAPPTIEVERGTTLLGARMTLTLEGRSFDSGMHWAADRRTAEQMAAKVLLDALAGTEDNAEPDEWVTAEDEERLRQDNPKGALLALCARLRLTPPRFEVRPVVTPEGPGFEASACVERDDGEEVWSDLRRAQRAKTAEQAAAASLLLRLGEDAPTLPAFHGAREPRAVLNELRQSGVLRDYGFVLERLVGPPHAPVFHMNGFAVRASSGERLEVAGVEGASKREAERLVAKRLLERL